MTALVVFAVLIVVAMAARRGDTGRALLGAMRAVNDARAAARGSIRRW